MLNILEAEQRVYKLMGQSTQQLQRMAEEKVGFLMAIQHEITRQLDELEWGEGFLAYLRSVLPPPDFLMLWSEGWGTDGVYMYVYLYTVVLNSGAAGSSISNSEVGDCRERKSCGQPADADDNPPRRSLHP
eukprot:GHVU01057509.1.p1 GENE.GHVU01057509.1~~GHVU01057509.1.p1  ORF type:complete len:131 (-),score=18.16 GHVU01057509.1:162-554(-)